MKKLGTIVYGNYEDENHLLKNRIVRLNGFNGDFDNETIVGKVVSVHHCYNMPYMFISILSKKDNLIYWFALNYLEMKNLTDGAFSTVVKND